MNILVVDDDPDLRQSLAAVLKDAGHEITEAADGRAAMAHLAATTFDTFSSVIARAILGRPTGRWTGRS